MTDDAPRTLVIGEALIDAVTAASGATEEHVGGSPANVAFGLAALDHAVDLATWIATDERGRRIEAVCRSRGVGLTPGSQGAPFTSVAHAHLDENGSATYDFDFEWHLAAVPRLTAYGHVHIGSIAAVLEPGGSAVRSTIEAGRSHATVSYDPNVRPTLMGRPAAARQVIEAGVALSDVVKVSDEDLAWLRPDEPIEQVLEHWAALGPRLLLVTRGGSGSVVHLARSGERVELPAPDTKVVDTVGAGDSFMAGLISGLIDAGLLGGAQARNDLRRASLADVLPAAERALAAGGLTVSRAGAHAPTRADLGVRAARSRTTSPHRSG